MAIHQPFDLEYWYVQVLAGDNNIFLALAFFSIALISAKFQLPYVVTMMVFTLFTLMFGTLVGGVGVLVLLIVGILGGWTLARIFKT